VKTTDIGSYLESKGSPLASSVPALLAASHRYRVDPRLIVAISGAETSFGKAGGGPKVFNAWGIGPGRSYSSWADGYDSVAKLLREGYLNKGYNTIPKIQAHWAPIGAGNDPANLNSAWTRNVSTFYSELGGNPTTPNQNWRQPYSPSASPSATSPVLDNSALEQQGLQNLLDIARGKRPTDTLSPLLKAALAREPATPARTPASVDRNQYAFQGAVSVAPGANRHGVNLSPDLLAFARSVSGAYGNPLTITTGTNHNQYVVGTRRQSAHWNGDAADIAASGKQLLQMGRAALIAAGMDPRKANRQTGGLFNIGGYQIIFRSNIGGNHWNHLHIGLQGG